MRLAQQFLNALAMDIDSGIDEQGVAAKHDAPYPADPLWLQHDGFADLNRAAERNIEPRLAASRGVRAEGRVGISQENAAPDYAAAVLMDI